MNKVRKKLILYAELAIFVLLTALLSIVNVINFTMVSDDADRITQRLASSNGSFDSARQQDTASPGANDSKNAPQPSGAPSKKPLEEDGSPQGVRGRFGQMGPESPETDASMRYFTYAFDDDGNATQIEFKISVVTEDEAKEWAQSLIHESTGWTKGTYRYRVYAIKDQTYVTVIDQGRELLPSYRILMISVCGEIVVLILCILILFAVSRRLLGPLEEADRKQKQFIASVEQDFKLPITLINANTELIEKENGGPTEYTKSINRQVRKMTKLLKRLSALSIYEDTGAAATINLSDILSAALDRKKQLFAANSLRLDVEIAPEVLIQGTEESMRKVCEELIDNSVKFAQSYVSFSLEKHTDRIILHQRNDTGLPNGSCDQIFDRFIKLENASQEEGVGLGLSYVKDVVRTHSGRVHAMVENQTFDLNIDF